jgi:hypothetical protein
MKFIYNFSLVQTRPYRTQDVLLGWCVGVRDRPRLGVPYRNRLRSIKGGTANEGLPGTVLGVARPTT